MSGEPFSVVFAGGGAKTFWAMGVLRALADMLPPITDFAGVSAGAAMSVVQVSGKVDAALEHFLAATGENRRNFYPGQLIRGGQAFPHEAMMRRALRFVLADGGFSTIRRGPPIHILLSYIPAGRPPLRTGLAAYRAYERRDRSGRLHGPSTPPLGIGAQVVSSHAAMDGEQLIDWVAMSSSTPPVTSLPRRAGRRYIDGAVVDNVPVRALPEASRKGRILVLLSSPKKVARKALRQVEGGRILYLAPADETPAQMWDFSSPERLLATWELGQREGAVLRDRVKALL